MKASRHQSEHSLIYLAGFMGSGKSTVGPILANTLGYSFIDIDTIIEERAHQRIVKIFETIGEVGFRTLEREVLSDICQLKDHVISLGGGTITNEENFEQVCKSGIVVYLKLSPAEILKRVRNKKDRPMLKNKDGSPLLAHELPGRIERLLQRREQFYNRADIIVSTDHKRVGVTVDEIVQHIRTRS
jgi:shikimate kinase